MKPAGCHMAQASRASHAGLQRPDATGQVVLVPCRLLLYAPVPCSSGTVLLRCDECRLEVQQAGCSFASLAGAMQLGQGQHKGQKVATSGS